MKKSRIMITFSQDLSVDVQIDDESGFGIGLLGGLEYAKSYILQRIHKLNASIQGRKQDTHLHQEATVSRDEAMDMYIKLGQLIQDRLIAINNASDHAEFTINRALLDELK